MSFFDLVTLVGKIVQREGCVTYRALQRDFGFDPDFIDDLRHELIFRGLAQDLEGIGLQRNRAGQPMSESPAIHAYPLIRLHPLPPLSGLASTGPESPAITSDEVKRLPAASGISPLISDPDAVSDQDSLLKSGTLVPVAERRQLTVMFCDFISTVSHPQHLDPEELRELIQAYQEAAAEVIAQYQGHIAQYLDHGLLVYFGYPAAHEDDAPRAVYTALGIIGKTVSLGTPAATTTSTTFAARIGIHTGPVVVGEMGGGTWHERLALGATPNIAARIRDIAAPNTVVLSQTTANLVHETFTLTKLDQQSLRGVEERLETWRVERIKSPEHDEVTNREDRATFLVGRDEESGLLVRRWQQSLEGYGQVVLVAGEAGIGKSSLVNRLRLQVAEEGHAHMTLRCSAYHQHSTLYPIIDHLYRLFRMNHDEATEVKLEKLREALKPYRFFTDDVLPLFSHLLSIAQSDRDDATAGGSASQQRQHTLDALVAWQLEEAERNALLVVWEDVHWADPSTLDVLGLLIDQAPTVGLMTVVTFRPEFVPPWPLRTHMTPLTLNRLEQPQVEMLLHQLAAGKQLPPTVVQHILHRTDGVPLYVEELTKMLLESDILHEEANRYQLKGQLSDATIPTTLHDSLMARLDRLPTVREVAQLGAVLGREFSYDMLQPLAALVDIDETSLQDGLNKLVDAELLYQRGRLPRVTYIFKHALVRDTAYQSLLRRTRQRYHEQVAQVLVTHFPSLVIAEPEIIAHHYTEAGATESALTYWHHAGQRAIQRSANLEAIEHLSRGLSVLESLPNTSDYIQQELQFHTTLGPAVMAAKGYAAEEVEHAYLRARELCVQVGEPRQLFQTLLGLWNVYLVRAEIKRAQDLAEQCLTLAQRLQDKLRLQQAHYTLGNTLFHGGALIEAHDHLERSVALYDSTQHHVRAVQNPGVVSLSYMAWTLWYMGFPDQALQKSQEALDLARTLAHPYSLTFALDFSAWLFQFRQESRAARHDVQAAISLATEQSFPLWLAMGMPLAGWTQIEHGQQEAGLTELQTGMTAFQATGAEVFWPNMLILLADAHRKSGQPEAALLAVEKGLTTVEKNHEHVSEAELHRLKGEVLLDQSLTHAPLAESCFLQALSISEQQRAKSLELRATVSLCRLWQRQGRHEPARARLSSVYEWFTEGFATADLRAAKSLLETLTHT